jgi:hypothetical protein
MEELLIDDYIATQERHAQEGMATTRPALAGLGGSRAEIYGVLSIDSTIRRHSAPVAGGPSCRAATDSTRHRLSSGAIRLGQRCIAGSVRESFSSPSLRAGMAFAFGERRRSDGRASGWIS